MGQCCGCTVSLSISRTDDQHSSPKMDKRRRAPPARSPRKSLPSNGNTQSPPPQRRRRKRRSRRQKRVEKLDASRRSELDTDTDIDGTATNLSSSPTASMSSSRRYSISMGGLTQKVRRLSASRYTEFKGKTTTSTPPVARANDSKKIVGGTSCHSKVGSVPNLSSSLTASSIRRKSMEGVRQKVRRLSASRYSEYKGKTSKSTPPAARANISSRITGGGSCHSSKFGSSGDDSTKNSWEDDDSFPTTASNSRYSTWRRSSIIMLPCYACDELMYPTEKMEKYKDLVYHKDCFKCTACRQQLHGVQVEMDDNDDLYCDTVAPRNCHHLLLQQRRGHTSATAIRGTRAGTKEVAVGGEMGVEEIIEAIGADLDAAIDGLRPRCDMCGGTFHATDKLMMLGMVKWHKECYLSHKPMRPRDMTARQAIRFLPQPLVLRVTVNGKSVTYFFVPRGGDEGVAEVMRSGGRTKSGDTLKLEFIPDPAARASPCRSLGPALPNPEFRLEAGGGLNGVGEGEFGSANSAGPCSSPDSSLKLGMTGALFGRLVHQKFNLRHTLRAEFRYAASGGANGAATLTAQEASISIRVP